MEQVGEVDGASAYEKMRRTVERASQPLMPSQFPSHDGPERDYGPSRSYLFPLWSDLFLCGPSRGRFRHGHNLYLLAMTGQSFPRSKPRRTGAL